MRFKSFFRSISKSLNLLSITGLFLIFIAASCSSVDSASSSSAGEWVGTWSTAPQLVEVRNNPPDPGLTDNTIRQVLRVSLGGEKLRVKFTNEFSNSPVTMRSVHIALSAGGSAIDPNTDTELKFNGNQEVTMEPGKAIMCDPFSFSVQPRTDVTITIFFGNTSPDVTGHPGSRTTSYILTGNHISDKEFTDAVTTEHWYVINTIDVMAPESAAAVAILGNSITDGRGSGTNKQNRWPDELARRLQENPATQQVAVLNEGIGGNCVLRDCLGPAAVSRFERDVLNQSKVKWLIILEGVNDIGGSRDVEKTSADLIAAFESMIDQAHAKGIKVYGATIMPFGKSFYDSPGHQEVWTKVNDWIRGGGKFDAVIDLAKAMSDPSDSSQLIPEGDSGDHLHPSEAGHRMMAEAVDLSLFK